MEQRDRHGRNKRSVLLTILVYVTWLVSVAGAFFLLLLVRNAVLVIIQAIGIHWLQARAVDRGVFIFMVVLFLGFVVFSEQYLQRVRGFGLLVVRFLRLAAIEVTVLFGAHAVLFLGVGRSASPGLGEILLLAGEMVLAVVLFVVPPMALRKVAEGDARGEKSPR